MDLVEWLDNTNPHWRDGDIALNDDQLIEELTIDFLKRRPDWLDDIVPPCIEKGRLEWVANLFEPMACGSSVTQAKYTIFGYIMTTLIDDMIDLESRFG
jgi:hypothetical protein